MNENVMQMNSSAKVLVEFERVRKALPKSKPLANNHWQSNGGNGSGYSYPTPGIQFRPMSGPVNEQ